MSRGLRRVRAMRRRRYSVAGLLLAWLCLAGCVQASTSSFSLPASPPAASSLAPGTPSPSFPTSPAASSSAAASVTPPPSARPSTTASASPHPGAPPDLYAGSAAAVSPQGTVSIRTLTTPDGRVRSYRLFVPAGGLGIAPLLVALHGGLGSGAQFEVNSGFDGLATSNRFLVAYPDGIAGRPGGTARTWNGGDCCGAAAARDVDDVAFLRAVVLDVADSYAIDPNRVYVTGHSNGGILALRLACEAADLFAAAGVQSAALGVDACQPARPVSLLQIHGTADTRVPLAGGAGSGLAGVSFRPPRQAARTIAIAGGCREPATTTTDRLNKDLVLTAWPGCPRGTAVEFLAVTGAGHAWMGHRASSAAAAGLVGQPYRRLDSSRAVWSFLAAHPRAMPGG